MLDKKHRLPKFINFSDRQVVSSQAFLIKEKDNQLKDSRFGIIVSKKIDKSAVGRNKIKRLIRDSIQEFLIDIKKGKDVLIISRTGVRDRSQGEVSKLLAKVFKKINILK